MRPQLSSIARIAPKASSFVITARASSLRPAFAPRAIVPFVRAMSTVEPKSRSRSPTRLPGPVETVIQQKLIEAFDPVLLRVYNDSSKHSHHAAMRAQGGGSGETHFAVHLVSAAFKGKTVIARHRLVNALLKEEFDERGLHALSLRLKTPEEWEAEGGGEMR
ncbi:hypothetical protein IAT38_001997 [Cryptococcus sp. DSM 104549]